MTIAGVVLAAGRSSRLGRAKQLLPFDGKPLLQHVVDAACASRLDDVIVVLGQKAQEVASALHPGRARLVVNDRFAEGQSTSVHRGLESTEPATQAAMILLGDQPGVTSPLINQIVDAYLQYSLGQHVSSSLPRTSAASSETGSRREALIVAPRYTDGIGNPVLFDRAFWPELFALRGDTGARELLRLRRSDILEVPIDRPRLVDVDTWEDYQRLALDRR